jgi:TetR/AcrR family transcriptional regulator, repressor for uid operon
VSAKPDQQPDLLAERRTAILDAAERCFVLHGFHRTTMQDLARMAGMSVGNLYRYFPAKDAVVLALAERDRAEAARHLCDVTTALWPALASLIRRHLVESPREKAVLLVEVWAEGTRNPTIAAMLARFDAENQAWIAGALSSAGALAADEAAELADRIRVETQGICVARALSAAYDPAPAVERLLQSVEARLGTGRPSAGPSTPLGVAA